MPRPPALELELPPGWIRYQVQGFQLVAAGPGGVEGSPRLIAASYAGEPAVVEQLDRMYVVEDTDSLVDGLSARRVDLTRWNGEHAVFTRRWLVRFDRVMVAPNEATGPAARAATLEISAHCLVTDYQRYTHLFDATVAGARLTVSGSAVPGSAHDRMRASA